jgi:predicted nucleotidyltransferase
MTQTAAIKISTRHLGAIGFSTLRVNRHDILKSAMTRPKTNPARYVSPYRYQSPNIPLSAIRRFARQIAEKFQPDKIILFGSYAYGTPREDSDVDLLVIMPCRNALDQSVRIDNAFERPFIVDLIVRTPRQMDFGLRDPDDRDWFLWEIVGKGKVLYEAPHRSVGPQGRRGPGRGKKPRGSGRAAAKRGLLPLPTTSRKILQGDVAGTRPAHPKNSRPGRAT